MANYNSNRTGLAHDNDENRLTTLENQLTTLQEDTLIIKNNTDSAQFLRGDKVWSNRLAGPQQCLWIKDTSTAADTYSIIRITHTENDSGAVLFLNGPSRSNDGGANMFTMRNDVGDLRLQSNFYFKSQNIPEDAANLNAVCSAPHSITFYNNGLLIPYQMDNTNDGGIIRCRGLSESDCIFEIGTWDDSGAGETIRFAYYPTTSRVTPTYSITVPKTNGTMSVTSSSSRRVKEDIKPMKNNEAYKLLDLNVISFDYKKEYMDKKNQFGLIAEEVDEIIPFCVHKPDDKPETIWSIDYSKLTPYLIKLAQLQQEEINTLKQKVEQLEQVINSGEL